MRLIILVLLLYLSYSSQRLVCTKKKKHTDDDPASHRNWKLVNDAICGSSLTDRIIGGTNASLGQYPWMARIGYYSLHNPANTPIFRCGGALINECYVLTAAHCVTNLPEDLYVGAIRLGEYDLKTDIDCKNGVCSDPTQDFYPKQILVNKDYGNPPFKHDIALVKLNKKANYTKWVSPICLPFDELMTKNLTGQKGEVAGWGFFDISIPVGSEVLQTVTLPIIYYDLCTKAFRRSGNMISDKDQMCVGGQIGKDSCNGDSGGPLMMVHAIKGPPKHFIIAIVSFGARYCGLTTAPAVYTRVSRYMKWILNNIEPC